MPIWETSILLPIGASAATTLLISLTIGPRLAARGKRIQTAHDNRDRFSDSVLDILVLCANLETVTAHPDDPGHDRLQSERDRWTSHIDDTTRWLADHWQHVALGWPTRLGIADLAARYIGAARGVWLSERPLQERARILKELTEPVQTIYFARRWRVMTSVPGEINRLSVMLDKLENLTPTSAPTHAQTAATPPDTPPGTHPDHQPASQPHATASPQPSQAPYPDQASPPSLPPSAD